MVPTTVSNRKRLCTRRRLGTRKGLCNMGKLYTRKRLRTRKRLCNRKGLCTRKRLLRRRCRIRGARGSSILALAIQRDRQFWAIISVSLQQLQNKLIVAIVGGLHMCVRVAITPTGTDT